MPPRRRRPEPTSNDRRVILYVRVSALMGRSGEDFHSPGVQTDSMRGLVIKAGLREVAVIDDDIDASGQTFNRRGIAKIRAMVEARQADIVAVHTLDRVGRNLAESLAFIRWLREHNVRVMSATEEIDDSPEGQFMVGMWLNLAELRGNQIGANWARIIERRARSGKTHGPANQGYIRQDDGRYVIDPTLGPAITAMFTAYAQGGLISDITATVAAARGKPIRRGDVKEMLRNPVYIGTIALSSKTGGYVEVPNCHEALVDDVTWRKVQRRLQADRYIPPRHLGPSYSLTGLGICVHCNHRLQVTYSVERGKDQRTRRLFCYYHKHAKACDGPGIGAPRYDAVEAAVLEAVRTYAEGLRGNPEALAVQISRVSAAYASRPVIEQELRRTRDGMGRLAEAWALRSMGDDAYASAMARLEAKEVALLAQLEEVEDLVEAPPASEVVKLVDDLLQLWGDMTGPERNTGLRTVLKSFTVRRAEFWAEPEEDRIVDVTFRW